jgi:hypothetical protein
VVHLGRLKAPRKAAGQMELLTVPSVDSVDSKVIQVEEALSASSRLATAWLRPFQKSISIPQRQTTITELEPARQLATPIWRHAELALRPVQTAALDRL